VSDPELQAAANRPTIRTRSLSDGAPCLCRSMTVPKSRSGQRERGVAAGDLMTWEAHQAPPATRRRAPRTASSTSAARSAPDRPGDGGPG
jgi:hypothetical protein